MFLFHVIKLKVSQTTLDNFTIVFCFPLDFLVYFSEVLSQFIDLSIVKVRNLILGIFFEADTIGELSKIGP